MHYCFIILDWKTVKSEMWKKKKPEKQKRFSDLENLGSVSF